MPAKKTLLLFCLITYFPAFSQEQSAAQLAVTTSRTQLINAYQQFSGDQSRLYNGINLTLYSGLVRGDAYFMTDSLQEGWVEYDGVRFDHVLMQYDLYRQEVLVKHFQGFRFSLLPEKTTRFSFMGHLFVRHENKIDGFTFPTAFYDHLYSGQSSVIARRFKILDEKIVGTEMEREFLPAVDYYVRIDGRYQSCNNSRVVYRLLGSKAKEVRRHLKSQRIRFKKNFENAMIESFRYADQKM